MSTVRLNPWNNIYSRELGRSKALKGGDLSNINLVVSFSSKPKMDFFEMN